MQRYIRNLWLALSGRDPYREELDEKNLQLEQAADNVRRLNDLAYTTAEKWDRAEKEKAGLQNLVETYRQRIKEYDDRIEAYNKEIDKLLRNT